MCCVWPMTANTACLVQYLPVILIRAFRIARGVETGRMWINAYGDISTYAAIFGGYKRSGIGREGHWRAFDHYTQMKSIVVNLAE